VERNKMKSKKLQRILVGHIFSYLQLIQITPLSFQLQAADTGTLPANDDLVIFL
jgi:hypothetical protein